MSFTLSRRTLLRGVGGAVIGLPVLECMLDSHGEALAQSAGAIPKRYALLFAGMAIGGDDMDEDDQFVGGRRYRESGHFITPTATGRGWGMTTPLEALQNQRDDFSIVSNLRIPYDVNSADPANVPPGGAFREFHGGGASPLLSGMRSIEGGFRARGITSDQVLANQYRGMTTHDSLVYRSQPSWYLSGSDFAGREFISYRGARDPIDAQTSPTIAFRSLFQGFTPMSDAAATERFNFRKQARTSVLDLVLNKRQALLGKVGAADRARLGQHFDELRELELRVQAIAPMQTGTCQVLTGPTDDPAVGGNNAGSGADEIGTNTGYSDEETRTRLFADLIHMAFVCDLTRVATLQITVFQSHMNVFTVSQAMGMPIRADLHEVGHGGDPMNKGQLPVSMMLKWHIGFYAYLIDKLKNTAEGAGNVLDNSAIVFLPEAGHGRQLNDGSSPNATHSVERMIALIAGRAGGLRPGQHIDAAGAHPVQALISAMQAAGYSGSTLGEVSGNIPALFT